LFPTFFLTANIEQGMSNVEVRAHYDKLLQ
jgi:hypothetical protein